MFISPGNSPSYVILENTLVIKIYYIKMFWVAQTCMSWFTNQFVCQLDPAYTGWSVYRHGIVNPFPSNAGLDIGVCPIAPGK